MADLRASKICVIDDVWMIVGSDNLDIRSWTNDSELSCAVIDHQRDQREQSLHPGGHGDGARTLARDSRLRPWFDGVAAIEVLRRSAAELDAWRDDPGTGPHRPGGSACIYPAPVGRWGVWWAHPVHRVLVDPTDDHARSAAPTASDSAVEPARATARGRGSRRALFSTTPTEPTCRHAVRARPPGRERCRLVAPFGAPRCQPRICRALALGRSLERSGNRVALRHCHRSQMSSQPQRARRFRRSCRRTRERPLDE